MSWRLVPLLRECGIDAVHVQDFGLADAPDEQVMAAALVQQRVLVTMDGDFASMLASTRGEQPSVLFLRSQTHVRPLDQEPLLTAAILQHSAALLEGAVVVITSSGARVRKLPLPGP